MLKEKKQIIAENVELKLILEKLLDNAVEYC